MNDPTEKELRKSPSWKDFKKCESECNKTGGITKQPYLTGHYVFTLKEFFYRIRTHKIRYFIFKPVMRLLHFDLISSILLNKRESDFAIFALLFELATVAVAALYFGLQISLFVFIGFGVLYILIYAVRRISLYFEWKKLTGDHNSSEKNNKKSEENNKEDELTDDEIFGKPQDKNYITVFMKKNYIAMIAFLFESAAITFTALYFSLQISLFVFIGFSLFYTLICATRKILSCCEPKISNYVELDNNNDSASVSSNEKERPLIENNLNKKPNELQPNNF